MISTVSHEQICFLFYCTFHKTLIDNVCIYISSFEINHFHHHSAKLYLHIHGLFSLLKRKIDVSEVLRVMSMVQLMFEVGISQLTISNFWTLTRNAKPCILDWFAKLRFSPSTVAEIVNEINLYGFISHSQSGIPKNWCQNLFLSKFGFNKINDHVWQVLFYNTI